MTNILQGFAGPLNLAGLGPETSPLQAMLAQLGAQDRNVPRLADQILSRTQGDASLTHSLQSLIKPHLTIVEQGELARALAAGADGKGENIGERKGEGFTIAGASHVFKNCCTR